MPRRSDSNCDEVCQEHSGLKTMVTVVLVGVICTVILQAYNTFIATARLESAIAGIQVKLISLDAVDNKFDRRVTKLEDVVFQRKSGGQD